MKQSSLKKALVKIFAFAVLSLFALSTKAGVDSYEIYLNNKLILKQYVNQPLNIKSLHLDKANASDRLVIFYSHCGQIGKGRSIAIKDDKGKILKEWNFANASGSNESMVIPVKELLQIATNNADIHVAIYYSAEQLPKGRMLTSLDLGGHTVTLHKTSAGAGYAMVIIFAGLFGLGRFLG